MSSVVRLGRPVGGAWPAHLTAAHQLSPHVARPPGETAVPWRTTPVAPALAFGRQAGDVLVRYEFAGTENEIRLSAALWRDLTGAIRDGRLGGGLGDEWTAWTPTVGLAALREGHVHLRHGPGNQVEERLPESVWQQLAAAVRSRAVDELPVITSAEAAP
ncbi:hypothetical protein FRACA_440045 [Frankia canadensis]|uniref:Uncharacterized protein n=1 Tax=Frankia canadensis TaxID=1836972 RepID=A0A2I2KXF6_9ACTN|nr:hypothetical protein [Frankia canadensis]SNQ50348.1 hypothetical protein FRACA_440045 [Frankia canadensis]SOU57638.1 hypothetical protein FRACA_440045 [Frankia canadensis]